MSDPPGPGEDPRDVSGEQRGDDPAAEGGRPGENHLGGMDSPWPAAGLPPPDADTNDTLVERGDGLPGEGEGSPSPGRSSVDSAAAFAYSYEADPLAEYWETPGAQVVLPSERKGQAGGTPPGAAGERRDPPAPSWSSGRILTAFGIALVVVAATSLSFGLMWGRSNGDAPMDSRQVGSSSASGSASGSPQQSMVAQARQVDRLLSASTGTRDEVITAVVQTRQCKHTSQSARTLRAAANKRERLVARLRTLDVNAIPRGDKAVASLRRAWTASARTDRAFAAWARDVGGSRGCPGGNPVKGHHYRRAVRASATASEAKARFVRLWNPVAAKTGLPQRSEDEI